MESEWAFLEPWRHALISALRHAERDTNAVEERDVQACFDCWQLTFRTARDLGVTTCAFYVEFPADVHTRVERSQLQRVREALEIFDRLAVVDNAAFRRLLSDFVTAQVTISRYMGEIPSAVWPLWLCTLSSMLSTRDLIARQSSVTWGELFGCPDDPWTTSTEFREVMQQLERMRPDRTGHKHNARANNRWKANTEAVLVAGCQKVVEKEPTNPFTRELNKLFELHVPLVVQLEAVRDRDTMMAAWQQPLQPTGGVEAFTDDVTMVVPIYYKPGIPEITAAFARADMTSLSLSLGEYERSEEELTVAAVNAGFLFSTMASGRSVCKLQGADRDFPAVERTGKCPTWDVQYSRSTGQRFGAMFSAIAETSSIGNLRLSTDDDYTIYPDPVYWSWLAYSLWSKASISSVTKLEILLINLTEEHVAAVERVLKTGYPVAGAGSVHAQFGYVTIPQDTEVRLLNSTAAHKTPLVLSNDHRCRAYYDSSYMGRQADVIVPGYGVCRVELQDGATQFIPDAIPVQYQQSVGTSCDISSLSLGLFDVSNNSVVPKLLRLIGGRLRSLSIKFFVVDYRVELDLSKVAEACRELEVLKLVGCNVLLPVQEEAIQNWGLKKLVLHKSHPVDGLESCLRDRRYRMARELVELDMLPLTDVNFMPDYITSLMAHNGEVLPITKTKLPLSSRLAMISVVRSQDELNTAPGMLHGVQYLDASILSTIFAFAAVPEQRMVGVGR